MYQLTAIISLVVVAGVVFDGLLNARGRSPGRVFQLALRSLVGGVIVLHGAFVGGWLRAGEFIVVAALLPYLAEAAGVRFGFFGTRYIYLGNLGTMLPFGVPALIPVAWGVLLYTAFIVRFALAEIFPLFAKPLPGILVATSLVIVIDLFLDPIAIAEGRWRWEPPGRWWGAPVINFAAWFVTAGAVYWIVEVVVGAFGRPVVAGQKWLLFLPAGSLGVAFFHMATISRRRGLKALSPFAVVMGVALLVIYGWAVV